MTTPRWLTSDEREAWLHVAALLELLPAALDAQLHRDADLTVFEYFVLAMLSEAPERHLRMSELAAHTNATLPRLSRVVAGLERQGLLERRPCPDDGRATNAHLTEIGWGKLVESAPGHVEAVRRHVIDPLSSEQLAQFGAIAARLLETLDPDGRMLAGARRAAGSGEADATADGAPVSHPLPRLAAPSARSLRTAGYATLESLAGADASAIAALPGVGRSALQRVRDALAAARLEPLAGDETAR